jgi:preprotein translocase subunit YajC
MLVNLFQGIYMQAQPDGGFGSIAATFVPFLLIILVFYFLILRPQQKRQKERQKLLEAVKEGDEVVTTGGIYGKVDHIENNIIYLKIAENLKIRVEKSAVGTVVGVTDKLPAKR